jgi:iron complex transport system ATP-binding protein
MYRLSLAERARCRAFLPQRVGIAFAFPVVDVVAMGLAPFGIAATGRNGRDILEAAMADADVARFAARPATQLSGGEQQRVHIARTLTQIEAARHAGIAHPLLLLDEPLTGLDYAHQFALMARFAQAACDGATVLLSLHDLALGAAYADWLLLLGQGQPPAFAPPETLMEPETIAAAFALSQDEARRVLAAVAPREKSFPTRITEAIAAE